MAQTPAHMRASNRYNAKAYAQFAFRYRKEDPVFKALEAYCAKSGESKAGYIRKALIGQFERDGIECDADKADGAADEETPF